MQGFLHRVVQGVRATIAYVRQNPTVCFLAVLNLVGLVFFTAGIRNPHSKAPVFLAEIVLITLTVSYFFFLGRVAEELEQHATDVEAHPGGLEQIAQDLARMGNAIVQLNETARELDQMKALLAEFESYKKGLSVIRQDTAGAVSVADDVAKLRQELEQIKSTSGQPDSGAEATEQIENLNQAIDEAKAGREALAKSVLALKAEVQELRGQSDRISSLSEDMKKLQETGPAPPDLGDWKEKVADVEEKLKALDGLAKAAGDEIPDLQLAQQVQELSKEVGELSQSTHTDLQELGEELRRDISSLKAQVEGASEVGDVGEAITDMREEISALRGKLKSGGGAVASGAADDDLRKEVGELRALVESFAASQPNLEVLVDNIEMVSQQDRTLVHCALRIKNPSNKPNEIVAVRAELDSGRDRMTPTSIREWVPESEAEKSDRKVFLPMTVLESATSETVKLTVAGWPIERTQDSYAFRITVRDKGGNEFVQSLDVSPEKKKKK